MVAIVFTWGVVKSEMWPAIKGKVHAAFEDLESNAFRRQRVRCINGTGQRVVDVAPSNLNDVWRGRLQKSRHAKMKLME